MLTAKLLVALGAPLQLKLGETLFPVQPNPLNTCSLAIVPPSLTSELVRLMLCAYAAVMPHTVDKTRAAIPTFIPLIAISSPFRMLAKREQALASCNAAGKNGPNVCRLTRPRAMRYG